MSETKSYTWFSGEGETLKLAEPTPLNELDIERAGRLALDAIPAWDHAQRAYVREWITACRVALFGRTKKKPKKTTE